MKIRTLTDYLESLVPLSLQESYDNCGLLAGNPNDEVDSALLCLDVTEEVVGEAVQKKCGLIISHHPIIFSGLKKLTGATYVERTVISAIRNHIALYAMHTNLDNVRTGVNQAIAGRLGLQDCRVLLPQRMGLVKLVTFVPVGDAAKLRSALFEAGAGHIGYYDHCSFSVSGTGTFRGNDNTHPYVGKPGEDHTENESRVEMIFPVDREQQVLEALWANHPYEEVAYDLYGLRNTYQETGAGMIGRTAEPMDEKDFLAFMGSAMQAAVIRHTALCHKKVEKVAVCGGAGSFLIPEAIRAGADAFLTSDIRYHQFFDAEGKILLADIGHYESEQFTPGLIADILRKKFANFALHFAQTNTNPINYFCT